MSDQSVRILVWAVVFGVGQFMTLTQVFVMLGLLIASHTGYRVAKGRWME